MDERPFLPRRIGTAAAIVRLLPVYLGFALLKHVVPLGVLARLAWRDPRRAPRDGEMEKALARLTKIRKVLRVPDRDCLQRSLLLYRELSRMGADPVLLVGFRTTPNGVIGHAWVQAQGRILADAPDSTAPFVPICSFGRGGRVLSGSLTPRTA